MPKPIIPQVPRHSLAQFSPHIHALGFSLNSISQPWRHIIARAIKGGQPYVIKIAAHPTINPKTQHEVLWYRHINAYPHPLHFSVPHIYKTGFIDNLYYYVATDFGDNLLATKYPPDPKNLLTHLPTIADILIDLDVFEIQPWQKITNQSQPESLRQNVINKGYYLENHPPSQILLSLLTQKVDALIPTFSHGDFVPWHMLDIGRRRLGLIDAEHAKIRPRYYDLVYCYLRIRININQPALARQLINLLYQKLTFRDQNTFWPQLKPVLSAKLINLYWEVFNTPKPKDYARATLCDAVYREITQDSIL